MKKSNRVTFKWLLNVILITDLKECSFRDHIEAVKEFISTVTISALPLLVAWFVAYVGDHTTGLLLNVVSNTRNGELLIYVTSIVAPAFYIITKKHGENVVMPRSTLFVAVYGCITLTASIVFALRRINFSFDPISIDVVQNTILIIAMILFYLVLVFNNAIRSNPAKVFQDSETDFTSKLKNHRNEAENE